VFDSVSDLIKLCDGPFPTSRRVPSGRRLEGLLPQLGVGRRPRLGLPFPAVLKFTPSRRSPFRLAGQAARIAGERERQDGIPRAGRDAAFDEVRPDMRCVNRANQLPHARPWV